MEINSILDEKRTFRPTAEFVSQANIKSRAKLDKMRQEAKDNPEQFWGTLARNELHWFKKFDQVLEWNPPYAKWFQGGQTNLSYNCLDRHLDTELKDRPAIIWEGEPGDTQTLSYKQLHRDVCKFANVLKKMGVEKGDTVGIYLPMIPEAAIAMLACVRIGAVHTVIFGGFSANAIRDRLLDAEAKLVITADGGFRKDSIVPLKPQIDAALEDCQVPSVKNVIVVRRSRNPINMKQNRDYYWHDLKLDASADCEAVALESEDPAFILYTSGTTGKPKGALHTTAGYNLHTHMTSKWVLDIKPTDVYWCTADVGWITGHSFIVYGPLSNGAAVFMYEGAPRPSKPDCFWKLIEKHKVSIFYTAPTAIRSFMASGDHLPNGCDLSSLRLLGTVGEPINPEAWVWYHSVIGKHLCPIVDTWWQTETGGMMIAPLPGLSDMKPGSCSKPLPGIEADIVDEKGLTVKPGVGGLLVIKRPWPGMMRTLYRDSKRFEEVYWSGIKGSKVGEFYFAGDGARMDTDGDFWVMGRIDDVMNVSGHRLGTMEIESALVSHPKVMEAAVVGMPCELKGESIFAFVTVESESTVQGDFVKELKMHVATEIGSIAVPQEIEVCESLPKTRSGKIMRRFLKSIAAGEAVFGDISTLEDQKVLDSLQGKKV